MRKNNVKICIPSSADDNVLRRFLSSLQNIHGYYECYILRNKPTSITSFPPTVKIRQVPNSEYVINDKVLFVKLRYDSVMMSEPRDGDIIMIGDDDFVFPPNFCFDFLPLFANGVEHITLSPDGPSPQCYHIAKISGINSGQYMRYDTDIWATIKRFNTVYGGGEDNLISLIYYKKTKGKCIWAYCKSGIHNPHHDWTMQLNANDDPCVTDYIIADTETFAEEWDAAAVSIFERLLTEGKLTIPPPSLYVNGVDIGDIMSSINTDNINASDRQRRIINQKRLI